MPNERQSPLGTKTQENNDSLKFQELKFLIEQHYKEVAHFWTRTNILLITNVAAFGGVLSKIYTENSLNTTPRIIISLLGLLFCCIWFVVNRITVYYEKRWLDDARRLAQSNCHLKSVCYLSLGFREPGDYKKNSKVFYYLSLGFRKQEDHTKEDIGWLGDEFVERRRPRGFSATDWMYVIIILFGAGWICLLLGFF